MNSERDKNMEELITDEEYEVDNFKLGVLKTIYFFLYAAFGSLWPYIILYFRQIGLQPYHAGSVAGIRPLIQFISCPLWTFIADKYSVHRLIFSFSMMCWLLMTIMLVLPYPKHYQCSNDCIPAKINHTHSINESVDNHSNISIDNIKRQHIANIKTYLINSQEVNHYIDNKSINSKLGSLKTNATTSNQTVILGRAKRDLKKVETDHCSHLPVIIFDKDETHTIFIQLFFITAIGEFFSSPAIAILDMSILEELGPQNGHFYGRTRMYGSLGFGLASLGIGAALDIFPKTFCNHPTSNYMICFIVFGIIMLPLTIFTTIHMRFEKISSYKNNPNSDQMSFAMKFKYIFNKPINIIFFVMAFYLGFSHGSIMNFINWFMEDLGATRFLMGVATAMRDIGVMIGFYLSPIVIDHFSSSYIIIWTCLVYIFSYFAYSLSKDPWSAILIESIQGISYAISWSFCIYFGSLMVPRNLGATIQGFIQAIYWGLGTGVGAITGGYSIQLFGIHESFRLGAYLGIVFMIMLSISAYLSNNTTNSTENELNTNNKNKD